MTHRRAVLLHPIVASDIPGINSGIIRRLQPAGSSIAFGEDAIAVRAVHQLATPCGHTAVSISEMCLASSQELVRQLEVEVVADTLRHGKIARNCIAIVTRRPFYFTLNILSWKTFFEMFRG